MLFEDILTNLKAELKDVTDKTQEAVEEQQKAFNDLNSEMETLKGIKRSNVKEYKRFGIIAV